MQSGNIYNINLVQEFVTKVNDIHDKFVGDIEFNYGLKHKRDNRLDGVLKVLRDSINESFELLKKSNKYVELKQQLLQLGINCFEKYRNVVIHEYSADNDIDVCWVDGQLRMFDEMFMMFDVDDTNDVRHELQELDKQCGSNIFEVTK